MMKRKRIDLRNVMLLLMATMIWISAIGQDSIARKEPIVIPPLFQYIEAPDSLPDITSRANYLMDHFWDPMDFNVNTVGQIPLTHAFAVYATPMRWANKSNIDKSLNSLINKLQKHPVLLLQFTKAAEDNLYSASAPVWIDDAYLPFLKAVIGHKGIDNNRKAKYRRQYESLMRSMRGELMTSFGFTLADGNKSSLKFTTPLTLIEFGNPSCTDCRVSKVKLQTNPELEKLIEEGKVAMYFIVPDAESEEGWDIELASYPYKWHSGAGEGLDDIYDIRNSPTFYLLGSKGEILEKNLPVDKMIEETLRRAGEL